MTYDEAYDALEAFINRMIANGCDPRLIENILIDLADNMDP